MKTVFSYADEKMTKTISALKNEYASIRAGRASAAVLDKIRVDYYGTPTPVNQLAAVSVAEARILTIQPWDKSVLGGIEKAIQASDIGINPQNDGTVIRLTFPPLTEDRRKEIVKTIRATSEDSKVAIRSIRRDCMDKLRKMEKASEITEDDLKDGEKQIQDKTDKYIKEIWFDHFEMECAHLKLAISLLEKYEKRNYVGVIGKGEFPRLLTLGTNKEYVRDVLERTILLTGDRQSYIDVMRLKDNADFFLYQNEIIPNQKMVPSHMVINKAIEKMGQDYRYQDKQNPIKELTNRKKDNYCIGRSNKKTSC